MNLTEHPFICINGLAQKPLLITGDNFPFNDEFGCGRDLHIDRDALHHLNRPAAKPTGDSKLIRAGWYA